VASNRKKPSKQLRLVWALLAIAIVEACRVVFYPQLYDSYWALGRAIGAVVINVALHLWLLPETRFKAFVSAFISQPSMWGLAGWITLAIKEHVNPYPLH